MPQMPRSKENPVTAAYASGCLEKLSRLLQGLDPQQVEAVGRLLHRARAEGRQVFLMGNGGSAALASHVAVDLGKGCSRGRERRFRVLSLTDNVPWMTAVSNDLSYEDVFAEQLANYAQKGDLVIAISGSGTSRNVLRAVERASALGCDTVGISGFEGGKLKPMVKHHVHVPSEHMGRIEDSQLIVCHILLYGFMDVEGCG